MVFSTILFDRLPLSNRSQYRREFIDFLPVVDCVLLLLLLLLLGVLVRFCARGAYTICLSTPTYDC